MTWTLICNLSPLKLAYDLSFVRFIGRQLNSYNSAYLSELDKSWAICYMEDLFLHAPSDWASSSTHRRWIFSQVRFMYFVFTTYTFLKKCRNFISQQNKFQNNPQCECVRDDVLQNDSGMNTSTSRYDTQILTSWIQDMVKLLLYLLN